MDKLLRFKPFSDAPAVAHLQRGINLLEEKSQRLIMDFASSFGGTGLWSGHSRPGRNSHSLLMTIYLLFAGLNQN